MAKIAIIAVAAVAIISTAVSAQDHTISAEHDTLSAQLSRDQPKQVATRSNLRRISVRGLKQHGDSEREDVSLDVSLEQKVADFKTTIAEELANSNETLYFGEGEDGEQYHEGCRASAREGLKHWPFYW